MKCSHYRERGSYYLYLVRFGPSTISKYSKIHKHQTLWNGVDPKMNVWYEKNCGQSLSQAIVYFGNYVNVWFVLFFIPPSLSLSFSLLIVCVCISSLKWSFCAFMFTNKGMFTLCIPEWSLIHIVIASSIINCSMIIFIDLKIIGHNKWRSQWWQRNIKCSFAVYKLFILWCLIPFTVRCARFRNFRIRGNDS